MFARFSRVNTLKIRRVSSSICHTHKNIVQVGWREWKRYEDKKISIKRHNHKQRRENLWEKKNKNCKRGREREGERRRDIETYIRFKIRRRQTLYYCHHLIICLDSPFVIVKILKTTHNSQHISSTQYWIDFLSQLKLVLCKQHFTATWYHLLITHIPPSPPPRAARIEKPKRDTVVKSLFEIYKGNLIRRRSKTSNGIFSVYKIATAFKSHLQVTRTTQNLSNQGDIFARSQHTNKITLSN